MTKYRLTGEKKRVVLDTNVVISAGLSREGIPAKIFKLLMNGSIDNFTTKEIIDEIKTVFARSKFKNADRKYLRFIALNFEKASIILNPEDRLQIVHEDPSDDKFFEVSLAGNVEFIISGDAHLLRLKEFNGIKILTPREFLEIMKSIY